MNEAETRAEHIDPALAAAGWGVVAGSRIRREYPITLGRIEGHGRRGKSLTADYVLEYRNTKLATVEAKAWDLALTEGVGQAKDYTTKLAVRWAYSTNGHGIYQIDMGENSHGSYGIDTRYGIGESHESHSSHHSDAGTHAKADKVTAMNPYEPPTVQPTVPDPPKESYEPTDFRSLPLWFRICYIGVMLFILFVFFTLAISFFLALGSF